MILSALSNIVAAQANLVKVLKVESATALNLGQIEVKFTAPVTKTTAEDLTNNYTLVAKSGSSAVLTNAVATLQADGKTVLIDLATAEIAANQETRKLEIKDVKGTDDQKLEKVSKDLSFFDITLPVAQKVVQTGTKTLKVTFSEPVKTGAGTFKINGGTYSAPTATFAAGATNRNEVTLTLGTALPTGDYTLTVEGVQDLVGLKNTSTDLTFAYGTDTSAPTVAIKEVKSDAKTVVLEFSKAIDSTTIVNNAQVLFSHTYNGQHEVTGTKVTKISDTVYNVEFTDVLAPGTSSIFIAYKSGSTDAQKVKDQYGNILVLPVTLQATVIADTTAPTVVSAASTAANKIEVVFSKDVNQADAQSSSNFILRDSDNKAVSLSSLSYVAADKKTTITTTADMKAGNYTLEIKNIKDKAVVPNTLTTVTKSLVVADKVAPKVDTVIYDGSANKLTVKFDKDMASTGLTTLSNYVLKVNAAQTAFPDGTVASIKDTKTVEIALGKTVTGLDGTNDSLDISGNFTDTLGNAIGGLAVNKAIVAASTVAPVYVADSAKFIAKDTLTFEVNTELQAIDPTKIEFNGAAAKAATYVNQGNKALVTVTVADAKKLTDTAASGWNSANILDIKADALTSSFGGKNVQKQLDGSAILDKVAPFISSVDTADTSVNGQIDQLTVTLSEAVLAGSVQASDFAISDGYTVNALLSVSGSTVVLRINESGAPDTGATPTVSIANTIEDLVGNTASTSEIVTSTDKAAPVLTYKSITTGANPTIVFDASEKLAAHGAVVGAIPAADKSLATLPTEGGTAWSVSMDGTTTVGISAITANDTTVTMTVAVKGTTAVGSTVTGSTLGTAGTGAIADLAANAAATKLLGTATAQ